MGRNATEIGALALNKPNKVLVFELGYALKRLMNEKVNVRIRCLKKEALHHLADTRFNTSAGNPVKGDFLIELPDTRSILTEFEGYLKVGSEWWITCGYPWPELEGKRFGIIQERLRSSAWCLSV
ncbi:hypothetical protein Tco_1000078 [Tanacetum coccineum]